MILYADSKGPDQTAQNAFIPNHSCPEIWTHDTIFLIDITKTRLFKYIVNFTTKKWNFSDKKF